MSRETGRNENTMGTASDAPASEPGAADDRSMRFDCCGISAGNGMLRCPCAAAMRRHPLIALALLALMMLACLAISTGVFFGIMAFLRAI